MSGKITVRGILATPPTSPDPPASPHSPSVRITSDSPSLHVKGIPRLTWEKCSSPMIHFPAPLGCLRFFPCIFIAQKNRKRGGRAPSLASADANAIPLMRVSCFYKKAGITPAGLAWNGVCDKARCHARFSTRLLPTAVRAEHRPRPHSDERPSLSGWDVSSSQTPASHRAPVTVAAYSCAHRPRGPRQGGLPSHINIFCLRSGVGELVGVNLGCSLLLSVLTSPVNLSLACRKSLTVWNERLTAPGGPSGLLSTDAVLVVLPFS